MTHSLGLFNLREVKLCNGAQILDREPLTIQLDPAAWAYAALIPLSEELNGACDSVSVHVELTVLDGECQVFGVNEDLSQIVSQESPSTSLRSRHILTLNVLEPERLKWLVFRTGEASKPAPKIQLHKIDCLSGLKLSKQQEQILESYPLSKMFSVVSWGAAGTTWLSRVLNSHPDIFAVHALNVTWSFLSEAEQLDGLSYILTLGSQGFAHKCSGDVHGVSRNQIPALRKILRDRFEAVVLVREPMARICSQLSLVESRWNPAWDLSYLDALIESLGLGDLSFKQRLFLHSCNMLNAIIEEKSVGSIYRLEDLSGNVETLERFVNEISQGSVEAGPSWLESALSLPRICAHNAGSRRMLSAEEQELMQKVLKPEARAAYQDLGYRSV